MKRRLDLLGLDQAENGHRKTQGSKPRVRLHPSPESLDEYAFSRLPAVGSAELAAHLERCEQCRDRLDSHKMSLGLLKEAFLTAETGGATDMSGFAMRRRMRTDRFGGGDVKAARDRLPISASVTSRCLALLKQKTVELRDIESAVGNDPVLASHIIRAANTALLNSGQPIRSIGHAIMHLGFERTQLHMLALSVRGAFASQRLKTIWDHSVGVSKLAREMARVSGAIPPEEACLAGLVHDIGSLVLAGLGPRYEAVFSHLREVGMKPVSIEWETCGTSHAEIGADLLADWCFPADLVEAVRYHHACSLSSNALASILFLAESLLGDEDCCDSTEYSLAQADLGLPHTLLASIQTGSGSDLDLLRFAA